MGEETKTEEIGLIVERDKDLQAWEHSRIIVHIKTFWQMQKEMGKDNFEGCWTLYSFYYATARKQKTNQPFALDTYCMAGLDWSKTKFYKYKLLLLKYRYIEQIQIRDDAGKFKRAFVKVHYMSKGPTVQSPKKWESGSPGVPFLPPSVKSDTNALNNKDEMLKVNKEPLSHPPKQPPINGYEKEFNEWYKIYPVKRGDKQKAKKAFAKLKPDEALLETMLAAIQKQMRWREVEARAGRFVPEWPYPATWLNGKRWEDEVLEEAAACPF